MSDVPPDSETPVVEATKALKAKATSAKASVAKVRDAIPKVSGRTMAIGGAAIGIGSAAIVAALLYTNRNKKS